MTTPVRNSKQVGNLIHRARTKRGWSQSDLGERTGLRQATISLIETGNPAAKLGTILTVLAALGLEMRVALRSRSQNMEEIF